MAIVQDLGSPGMFIIGFLRESPSAAIDDEGRDGESDVDDLEMNDYFPGMVIECMRR
jgi:hypothetical protein